MEAPEFTFLPPAPVHPHIYTNGKATPPQSADPNPLAPPPPLHPTLCPCNHRAARTRTLP